MLYKLFHHLKKDSVLTLSLLLALVSSCFSIPKWSYIDFKVLLLLFNLMIVVAAFKELKVLDYLAIYLLKQCSSYQKVAFVLTFITFISAMFVTNDVALFTFVPLTLIISKKVQLPVLKTVIFQTLAANLGSCLTPMGNPQNLFLYSYYNLSIGTFFAIMLPVVLLAIIFLVGLTLTESKKTLSLELELPTVGKVSHIIGFSILFFIILLSVFHVLDSTLVFLIVLTFVLLLNRKLLKQVDYSLLITFIGFFIFVGNVSTFPTIRASMQSILSSESSTYFTALISSQFISNVPATMLLSGFTSYYEPLLLGVNIGGLGTLIASLASVISYKLYIGTYENERGTYLKQFTFYNVSGLLLFVPLIYIISIL